MKLDVKRMTDAEIEATIGILVKERERRGSKLAKSAGISLSRDPLDCRDDRVLFNTPLGELLIWSNSETANIRFQGEDVDDWVYMFDDWVDDQDDQSEWVKKIDEGENQSDAYDLLNETDNILGEGLKLYQKWEPLFRLMFTEGVQEE